MGWFFTRMQDSIYFMYKREHIQKIERDFFLGCKSACSTKLGSPHEKTRDGGRLQHAEGSLYQLSPPCCYSLCTLLYGQCVNL